MLYQQTTATRKIAGLTKRIRGVAGGTSASKTISILLWLIDYAQTHKGELISVVSETMPHLRKGAMRDFENIMKSHNYWKDSRWNATNSVYEFETGTKMEFFSADQSDKVRGPRRQVLFVNEANNISYDTYDQLAVRTELIIFLDWNPVSEFWWYTEILGKKDVDFLILTYLDNEALHPNVVADIESHKGDKQWWAVYGEGKLGEADERIFTDWQIIDDIPKDAELIRYGLDFGYTNDPTAIVAMYRFNNRFIWDEICYQKGLSNKQIAEILLSHKRALVIADSAEPKSIDEIASYGVPIQPATKGPGSVLQRIQYVQGNKNSVTKKSTNIVKEYRNWLWLRDREGKIINEPDHNWSHSMDAGCYAQHSLKPTAPAVTRPPIYQPSDSVIGI